MYSDVTCSLLPSLFHLNYLPDRANEPSTEQNHASSLFGSTRLCFSPQELPYPTAGLPPCCTHSTFVGTANPDTAFKEGGRRFPIAPVSILPTNKKPPSNTVSRKAPSFSQLYPTYCTSTRPWRQQHRFSTLLWHQTPVLEAQHSVKPLLVNTLRTKMLKSRRAYKMVHGHLLL